MKVYGPDTWPVATWGREHAQRRRRIEYAILDAFERVERMQEQLCSAERDLARLIADDEYGEWPRVWKAFLAAGGLTRDELCRWMVNQKPIRPTVQRQHLRLVADGDRRQPQPLSKGGPEAA
jgi:hypothetical protein